MRVACIGGGASALMCACFVEPKNELVIIEKNEKVGKKILATGNGRCNLTNLNMYKCSYNQNVDRFLNRFNGKDVLSFFRQIGLEVYADEQGRVYPLSNSAISVLDVLKNYISLKPNVILKTETQVVKIEKNNNYFNVVYSNGTQEIFDSVIIGSGNLATEQLFSSFDIKFKPFLPSLCALKTAKQKNLAGVRVSNVKVSCKLNNQNFEEIGEVLFRDDGISGIVIFNLSAFMARQNEYATEVILDYMPTISEEDLFELLITRQKKLKNYVIDEFLTGFFHKAINYEILKRANLNLQNNVQSLTIQQLKTITNLIKNFKITTIGAHTNNQVACGGVLLSELDFNLQAKNIQNLYFMGEVIDVDGICGGYNLQWAWTSGYVVAQNLNNK